MRIYFRAFSSLPHPLCLSPLRHSPLPWKPLELRKIDKSSAAEQFVYSTARLRANELERITYSHGLSLSPSLFPPPSLPYPLYFATPFSTPFIQHQPTSPPPASPTRSLLPDDRPSSCACDRRHWHPYTSHCTCVYLFIPPPYSVSQCSFQLLTGSSVGKRGYLRPPTYLPYLIPSSL